MFENILGQQEITERLRLEVINKRLPGALLFFGRGFSGKLSTALELSRALSCSEKGEWSCGCRACRDHRLLAHPNTLMLGSRYFLEEIHAAADILRRCDSPASRFFFIRAVRKLTRRFDEVLWEGIESRAKLFRNDLSGVEENLENFFPENKLPEEKKLEKALKTIIDKCRTLSGNLKGDNIPIQQIRNVAFWTHTTSSINPKIIILEGADKMNESSRNALLKALEEPPEDTYYILLTTRKGGIIPTILSRVRHYQFADRGPSGEKEVLKKIFREDSDQYSDLRSYFQAWNGINISALRNDAGRMAELVISDEQYEVSELNELLGRISEPQAFRPFLEELIHYCEQKLFDSIQDGGNERQRLSAWNRLINDALLKKERYNQSPLLLLEGLFYSMKDMP